MAKKVQPFNGRLNLEEDRTKTIRRIAQENCTYSEKTSTTGLINRLLRDIADGRLSVVRTEELERLKANPLKHKHDEELPAMISSVIRDTLIGEIDNLINKGMIKTIEPNIDKPEI